MKNKRRIWRRGKHIKKAVAQNEFWQQQDTFQMMQWGWVILDDNGDNDNKRLFSWNTQMDVDNDGKAGQDDVMVVYGDNGGS